MLLRFVFHPCAVCIDRSLSHLHSSQVKGLGTADRPDDRVLQSRAIRRIGSVSIPDSFGNRVRPAWPRRRQCNDQRMSIPVSGAPFLHNMS